MQSRKICFVEADPDSREYFRESLEGHPLAFVGTLEEVPTDSVVVSIFVSQRVDEALLNRCPELRLLATRSTGCDHIDVEACAARSVAVVNVGGYGENSVAEHTFALMLSVSRRLRDSEQAVRTGRFSPERLRGTDLRGKTLGVVGAGRIGLHVIRIGIGFGMRVIAHDDQPHPFYSELLDFRYVPLEQLLRDSDVITLHVPLDATTRHLINRQTLAMCRDGVVLINTARGGLVDTAAVIEALDSGRISGVGLDVLEDERVFRGGTTAVLGDQIVARVRGTTAFPESREVSPERVRAFSELVTQSRLLQRPEVVLTPHVAYNSDEAVERLSACTVESIRDFLAGRPLEQRVV